MAVQIARQFLNKGAQPARVAADFLMDSSWAER
jgi:hypothetical protein